MTRSVIRTNTGYRVYGAFTCVMHLDINGNVLYSNMKADSKEYLEMFKAFKEFSK